MTSAQIASAAAPVFAGMKLYELLTLVGIIIGPITAVVITIITEAVRKTRDQRLQVLRGLISTLRLGGDPAWVVSMNMLLLEFHGHVRVMNARRSYMAAARLRPMPGNEFQHAKELDDKQITLVFEVSRALKFSISEGDLRSEVYLSDGFIDRDNLYTDSLRAMRELADAGKRSADAAVTMAEMVRPPNGTGV